MIKVIADTANARQHWDRRSDELPYLMVPMSDGSVIRYNAEIPQPAFQKAIQNVRNMKTGYERKEAE